MTVPIEVGADVPLVTIMIPTYNHQDFVLQAIASALAQTYPRLEVIVGDDASTDGTQRTIETFMQTSTDPRLKYVRNPATLGRVGNYRKLLFEHANGDYVLNLDGDDYLTEPNFILQARALVQSPGQDLQSDRLAPVMVVARATTITPEGPVVSRIPSVSSCTGLYLLTQLPRAPYMLMHMAVLYHRPSAIAADFYRSDTLSSDWESLYRLALWGRVAYLNLNVGVWRQHAGNQTATRDAQTLLANLRIWQAVYSEAQRVGMPVWRARLTAAVCVAHFASASAIAISRSGIRPLLTFIHLVAQEFKLASLIVALYPRYAGRVLLGVLGFYGRTALRHR